MGNSPEVDVFIAQDLQVRGWTAIKIKKASEPAFRLPEGTRAYRITPDGSIDGSSNLLIFDPTRLDVQCISRNGGELINRRILQLREQGYAYLAVSPTKVLVSKAIAPWAEDKPGC